MNHTVHFRSEKSWKAERIGPVLPGALVCKRQLQRPARPPQIRFSHTCCRACCTACWIMLGVFGSHMLFTWKKITGSGSTMLWYAPMLFSICSVCNHLAPLSICSCESSAEMLGTLDGQAWHAMTQLVQETPCVCYSIDSSRMITPWDASR